MLVAFQSHIVYGAMMVNIYCCSQETEAVSNQVFFFISIKKLWMNFGKGCRDQRRETSVCLLSLLSDLITFQEWGEISHSVNSDENHPDRRLLCV